MRVWSAGVEQHGGSGRMRTRILMGRLPSLAASLRWPGVGGAPACEEQQGRRCDLRWDVQCSASRSEIRGKCARAYKRKQ